MHRKTRQIDPNMDLARLEFLATIATEYEEELARRRAALRQAEHDRELQEFVNDITAPDWSRRDNKPASPELRDFIDEITGCGRYAFREAGWDPSQHPRAGGPPNPGWFARARGGTAGGDKANPRARGANSFAPASQRAHLRIGLAGGKNWRGDNVLDVLNSIAPEWLPFIKQHATLIGTSVGEKDASTSVHVGEHGPNVDQVAGAIDDNTQINSLSYSGGLERRTGCRVRPPPNRGSQ